MLYPKNQIEFESLFNNDAKCLKYLEDLKYENGYTCEYCSCLSYWKNKRGVFVCKSCKSESTATTGTIFHGSKIPLHLLFRFLWFLVLQKNGISAKSLQRILGFTRYETVWTWLHKFRHIMILPNRDRLNGKVEVDETFIGGVKPGKRGRGSEGKVLVIIAVELIGAYTGRTRMLMIKGADRKSINDFVKNNIEDGSTIVTDGWRGYTDLERMKYKHEIVTKTIAVNDENLTPHVHKIASLLKRWLLGTHQNFTSVDYLNYYLDEFTFRYNRRKSNSRGLLFYVLLRQAILHKPIYETKS